MSRTSVDLLRALTLTDSGSSTPRDDLHATARALFFSAQSTGRVKARITSNASGLSTTHPSDQPAEDRMLQTYPAHCFQDARFKDSVAIFDSLFRQAFASSTLAFSPLQAEVAAKPVVGKQSPTTAVKLSTPKRVLEVGCGSGAWMVRQTREWPKALFTGLDLFHNDLTADWMPFEVAERVHIVRGNFLEQLPFDDDSFEMVFVRSCAVGIPESFYIGFVEELARVCHPDGFIEIGEVHYARPDLTFVQEHKPGLLESDPEAYARMALDASLQRRSINTAPNTQIKSALSLCTRTLLESKLIDVSTLEVEEDHAQDTTETKAVLRAVIAAAGHATALPAWADYQDLTGAEIPLVDSDHAFKVWKQRELESAGIPTLLDGLGWSCAFDQRTETLLKDQLDTSRRLKASCDQNRAYASASSELDRSIREAEAELKRVQGRLQATLPQPYYDVIEIKSFVASPIK